MCAGVCVRMYLGLCGSAILVCATDIDAVVASASAVAGIHISAQHTPNDVTQVRNVVDVGQGTCDQNVSLACTHPHYLPFLVLVMC